MKRGPMWRSAVETKKMRTGFDVDRDAFHGQALAFRKQAMRFPACVRSEKSISAGDVRCPCESASARHSFAREAHRTRGRMIVIGMAKF
ncbi:hypothetical protein [Burkholderia savannae]|uniref:hypothetical protein n=1 Tax=Burkholderia savannae TaxID=1637837 RepID=UPI0018DB6861|nr:hypothetical protein [Burkholderia savannae]